VPDPRVTRLAEVLCRYSLEIGPGDTVLIDGPALAQPLFVEVV
jgi:leucyl aminopeptidase (aminopeptidase T)